MKKAFDQTFRDIKREVNKKVLKVPGIEQKVLDATSNEPWGPHGSLLADIAHASKNYNDYQLMMVVIWKRINDIGKNWRHVYKGLTVLEYLVAHGSERVIEEIKEHAYQISTLSDFQYIDSSGKDQGSNVRKKSQNLVLLVNDKERIVEVRQKAAANRDKFRNTTSTGGMYKPGSGGYGDRYDNDRYEDRYGSREDDRSGYGRERDRDYKDDDQYGKFGDNSGRDRDHYGRDKEDRYGRDDDYRGRSPSIGNYDYGKRGRSSDREREWAYDDDANFSSRGSAFRADEQSQEARRLDRKFSEQNLDTPPTYEEAVNDVRSPVHSERGGETAAASAPKTASPPASACPNQTMGHAPSASPTKQGIYSFPTNQGVKTLPINGVDIFDEFDPRGSVSVAASTSNDAESDLLALAIVPTYSEADAYVNSGSVDTFSSTSSAVNQPSEDPFGDTPFKATPSSESGFPPQNLELQQPFVPKANELSSLNYDDTSSANSLDILADILPPAGSSQTGFMAPVASYVMAEDPNRLAAQRNSHNTGFIAHSGSTGPVVSNMTLQPSGGTTLQYNSASFLQQSGSTEPVASHMASQAFGSMNSTHHVAQLAIVPQPSKQKFQTKSTVWTDTLNRGLVDLNISGSKTNTLVDIGVDFDAINRKEMRGKPSAAPIAPTITMGRAMGSGSGIGRGSVGALRLSSPNPMTHHGMAMGKGGTPGAGMGTVGYNGMGQHMGTSMGMPMNMGIGQGGQNQRPAGLPPGSNLSGGYNPMMGGGGLTPQPYRGGHR